MTTLWCTKKSYPSKALVLYTSSWWDLHYKNFKFNWQFGWKQSPSKLHANIQLLILGWDKTSYTYTKDLKEKDIKLDVQVAGCACLTKTGGGSVNVYLNDRLRRSSFSNVQ